jgi:hypothetical protein
MRKNQTIVLVISFLLIGLMLACSLPGIKSFSGEKAEKVNKAADNSDAESSTKPSAADCPREPLWVVDAKDNALEKYEGCWVKIKGKIWEIEGDNKIALIDMSETTGYPDQIFISGDFSNKTYSEIGDKTSGLKLKGEYEKLPVVTFTCAVDSAFSLDKCVLTEG